RADRHESEAHGQAEGCVPGIGQMLQGHVRSAGAERESLPAFACVLRHETDPEHSRAPRSLRGFPGGLPMAHSIRDDDGTSNDSGNPPLTRLVETAIARN